MMKDVKEVATGDVMFKIILGDPRHKNLLIHFLNCAIKSEDPIADVEITNCELTPEYLGQKGARLNIKAKTGGGELINIEVQREPDKHMTTRSLFYWSRMFSGQIVVGNKYYELKRTICISVLDFRLFRDDRYLRKGCIYDDETKEKMSDLLELHFFELNKLREVDKESPITFWIEFFRDPYSDAVKALCDYVPEIREAKEIYEKAKTDPKLRATIEAREEALLNYANYIACAKEDGIAEGELKGKRETALNAIKMGLSVEQAAQLTGLSLREIESLKDKRHLS
ncbi:MAG: Rpn family recombination-promoting nuclease/putative transposase [Holosporaceae bacterium]|nr:Rpn family recombination-promoting nuclease/putative transposase [Holosporaceae bacterium]